MKRFSLRYSLLTYRLDQLWFPLAILALFVIVCLFINNRPDQVMNTTRGYLGVALPLIAGILAAYAVLDDPALELRFATPISAGQTLFERLGLIFLIQMVSALSFQVFVLGIGGDFSVLGTVWDVQLAWLVPTLAMMALGSLGALAAAQTMVGALLIGVVWIVELIAREWFAAQDGWRYLLVFMGALMPDHPFLRGNQLALVLLAAVLFVAAGLLLRRQERFI
jgi:hypothetical protein